MHHKTSSSGKLPWIETPLIRSHALSNLLGCNVFLKLESLQPSGSFKSRGIGNLMLARLATEAKKANGADTSSSVHFYTSSGGNAGLACVHAAVTLGCASTVVVPLSTTDFMVAKLRAAGAKDVIREGASWQEADNHLTQNIMAGARARGETAIYVHPFDDPDIWSGHSSMVKEIMRQLPDAKRHYAGTQLPGLNAEARQVSVDAIVCSVGGGGLFCGIMQGLDELDAGKTRVITAETVGADALSQSIQQGEMVTLPAITSIATSLGARTVASKAFEYAQRDTVSSVVLTDRQAMKGCRRFLDEEKVLVEPACGVCPATCYEGCLTELLPDLTSQSNIVMVVCGGSNMSFDIMDKYFENSPEVTNS